jgi:hypothetical protein
LLTDNAVSADVLKLDGTALFYFLPIYSPSDVLSPTSHKFCHFTIISDITFQFNSTTVNRNTGHLFAMSERVKREQIPTEYNEEQTQSTLRRQDQVQGEQREKTISDFPQAAALAQVLKDLKFPADKRAIIRFVEQSNRPERNEVMPLVQRINDRQYHNVSEVAEAARLVQ